jgi:hypothetical protein
MSVEGFGSWLTNISMVIFVLQDMFELARSANYAEGEEKLNARQSKAISFSVSKNLLEWRHKAPADAHLQIVAR